MVAEQQYCFGLMTVVQIPMSLNLLGLVLIKDVRARAADDPVPADNQSAI